MNDLAGAYFVMAIIGGSLILVILALLVSIGIFVLIRRVDENPKKYINKNKRVYSEDAVRSALDNADEQLTSMKFIGEIDHPVSHAYVTPSVMRIQTVRKRNILKRIFRGSKNNSPVTAEISGIPGGRHPKYKYEAVIKLKEKDDK